MANEKHLAILKQGIRTWNQWRDKHPDIRPDLSDANLGKANLSEANFSRTNLWKADLHEADLRATNLQQADIGDAHLFKAYLHGANLQGANLRRAYLFHANLLGADLSDVNLSQASLVGTNLFDANLSRSDLSGTHLSRAYLNRANLSKASLNGAHLNGANFSEANLSDARLSGCQALSTNFTQAILTGACLEAWEIDKTTDFSRVTCDYVYLQRKQQQRCPHKGYFAPGDFAQLFQSNPNTLDLVFSNGINWEAFLQAFQHLQKTVGRANLSIQAFENHQPTDHWIVRIQTAVAADRKAMQRSLEQNYSAVLQTLGESLGDSQIAQSPLTDIPTANLNLLELAQLAARGAIEDIPQQQRLHQVIAPTVSLPPKPVCKDLPAHPLSQNIASPQSLDEIVHSVPELPDKAQPATPRPEDSVSFQPLDEIARSVPELPDKAQPTPLRSEELLHEIARSVPDLSGKEHLASPKHSASSERLSQAHVVALLMKVRQTIKAAQLPEPVKTGVVSYLKIAQQAMQGKPPQRKTAQTALDNIAEILAISSRTWQLGKDLWLQTNVILKIVKDWLNTPRGDGER